MKTSPSRSDPEGFGGVRLTPWHRTTIMREPGVTAFVYGNAQTKRRANARLKLDGLDPFLIHIGSSI